MDKFLRFTDLQRAYREGEHYRRIGIDRRGSILILAPHGGGTERGTSELARAIASDDLSLYLFEATMPTYRENKELHLTSTNFDEPICLELIHRFPTALAIHGCDGKRPLIHVGGRDATLKNRIIAELAGRGYPIQWGKDGFAGIFARNICNRTSSGRGVQLEFSNGMRGEFFQDWQSRKGRKTITPLFERFVSDLRQILE